MSNNERLRAFLLGASSIFDMTGSVLLTNLPDICAVPPPKSVVRKKSTRWEILTLEEAYESDFQSLVGDIENIARDFSCATEKVATSFSK